MAVIEYDAHSNDKESTMRIAKTITVVQLLQMCPDDDARDAFL